MGSQSGAGRCWHYVSPEYGFSVHNLLVIIRCVVSDGNKAAVHAKSKLFRPVRSAVLFAPHTDPARRCNTVGANREALGQHRRPAVNWGQVRTVWGGKDCTAGNRPECLIMIRVRVTLAGMTAAPYLELETLWSVCSAGGRQSPGKLRAAQGSRLTPQSSSLLCTLQYNDLFYPLLQAAKLQTCTRFSWNKHPFISIFSLWPPLAPPRK